MARTNNRLAGLQTIFTEDTLLSMNVASLAQAGQLGGTIAYNDAIYQLVKVSAAATLGLQRGDTVGWTDHSAFVVQPMVSCGGNQNFFAGIAMASVDTGKYGFIQVAGKFQSCRSNSAVASAGSQAIAKTSANGVLSASATEVDSLRVAITLGATTSSAAGVKSSTSVKIVPVFLFPPRNGW